MSAAVQVNAVTIYISGHGSKMLGNKPETRAHVPIDYDRMKIQVKLLSMAGVAEGVSTEVGPVLDVVELGRHPCYSNLVTEQLIAHLIRKNRSNEFGTLTRLIPRIYSDDPSFYGQYNSASSSGKLNLMLEEMVCLGTHSDIDYPKSSPPEIVPNPQFNKKYLFGPNPHEKDRRHETHVKTGVLMRSNPARQNGDPAQNVVYTYEALNIAATTNRLHKPFSLSDISVKGADGLVPIEEIQKRNLLTKHNYLLFWKGHIESLDFSDFPDEDVLDIGDIFSAIHIFKQLAYVFGTSITEAEAEAEADAEERVINELPNDDGSPTMPSVQSHSSGHIAKFKELVISLKSLEIEEKSKLVQEAEQRVQSARKEFSEKADFADNLEEMITEMKKEIQSDKDKIDKIEEMKANITDKTAQLEKLNAELEVMKLELEDADNAYIEKRTTLQTEKERHASLIEELDRVKNQLHEQIKQFIAFILMTNNEELKSIIKNIIMSNKLKNILKTGILYKRLSLRQLVTFFHGMRYEILDIIDPSCFKIEIEETPVVEKVTHVNTQEIPDIYDDGTRPSGRRPWGEVDAAEVFPPSGQKKKPRPPKPLQGSGGARNRNSSIRRTRKRRNNGGKTRKSKYSGKHHSHRKGSSTRQRKRR
jgi:hypothetical protein